MIVEDLVALREMLADVLAQKPEFEIVAQAESLDEALRLARSTQPDVVVLDWCFPGGGGESFLREMRKNRLQAHVLVLTGNINEDSVRIALLGGARGFFEKGGNLDEFFVALRSVAAGGAYFGPMASTIVGRLVDPTPPATAGSVEVFDCSTETVSGANLLMAVQAG
jgi:DNA-binding NarL/FixJ family response regulator